MRNQVAFVMYAIFLFVIITITQARPSKRKENIKALQRKVQSLMHPCDTAPRGTVIHTLNGDIICLQKTEQELQRQLEQNGGYNRRYAAATLAEAKKNFKNMFTIYGREYENTTDWQRWRNSDILKHDKGSFVEEHLQREGMISGRISRFGNYGDTRQRRSNDDSEIMKRGDPGINIQCLPGGRETEKGIHLCPACQRCTELSKDFFPRYINELTCEDSKSGNSSQVGCYLSNNFQIGTCQQIKMTTDVLIHKNGKFTIVYQNETFKEFKEVYEPYSLKVRTCCECMVFSKLAGQ